MKEDLMRQEGFPTADQVRKNTSIKKHNCYAAWLKKAKKSIVQSSRNDVPYCYFHLKYYINDRYDYVYVSLVNKEFKILNPINDGAQNDAEMLIYFLNKVGYDATPFVGEKPFEINRCNMSTQEDTQDGFGDMFVGHGALGLYVKW